MSGWIKVEKDLESDPRVLRMAKALAGRFELTELVATGNVHFEERNACALPGVTLVCGALARLWMYADSHARDDDTLDLSTEELDEWLGIAGFCDLMPADWLNVVDEHTIELPNFQAHNNTEAKKRALGQKRQEKYRHKTQRTSVSPRNAGASPDQTKTRPEETKTRSESQSRTHTSSNRDFDYRNGADAGAGSLASADRQKTTTELFGPMRQEPPAAVGLSRVRVFDVDPHEVTEACKRLYPKGIYAAVTWIHGERCIGKLLEDGEDPDKLVAAAGLYRDQQQALGKVGSQFVLSPKTFFGDGHWRGPFPLPAKTSAPIASIEEIIERAKAAQHG